MIHINKTPHPSKPPSERSAVLTAQTRADKCKQMLPATSNNRPKIILNDARKTHPHTLFDTCWLFFVDSMTDCSHSVFYLSGCLLNLFNLRNSYLALAPATITYFVRRFWMCELFARSSELLFGTMSSNLSFCWTFGTFIRQPELQLVLNFSTS